MLWCTTGELQLFNPPRGKRCTDKPASMADHEIDRLRSNFFGSHYQIPLIFPVLIVDDDDHLSRPEGGNCFINRIKDRSSPRLDKTFFL